MTEGNGYRNGNGDRPQSVVSTIRAIAENSAEDKISVEAFSKGLGRRSYGLLLVTLNLPNLIPLPLPLLSFIFGLPLALVALQLALGLEHPWIPAFLKERGIGRKELIYFCDKVDERYGKIHKFVRPRWLIVTRGEAVRVIGLAICFLATVMVLPIPFGNLVLAVPIALLSLGLIERDGLFVIAGTVLGVLGLIFNLLIGVSIMLSTFLAIGHLFD